MMQSGMEKEGFGVRQHVAALKARTCPRTPKLSPRHRARDRAAASFPVGGGRGAYTSAGFRLGTHPRVIR